jgi:transmembrane sensor
MNRQKQNRGPRISETALEEAGTWFALLHATDRKEDIPRGFRRWLALDPQNEAAFELVTHGWEVSHRLSRQPLALPRRWQKAGFRAGFARAVTAVAAASAIAIGGIVWHSTRAGVATEIGEQRIVTLEDGTRISLNTDTRMRVRYGSRQRLVELEKGEALFEVAREPARPFVVDAADRRVTALGTSFIVRRDAQRLSVTLVEGNVAVAPIGTAVLDERRPAVQTLRPGQRVTFAKDVAPSLDSPRIDQISAWRKGQVEMDHMPLGAAATEMNRYSELKLIVEGRDAAGAHVNGVFRAGDTVSFAEAMVMTCGLQLVRGSRELALTGVPSPSCRR